PVNDQILMGKLHRCAKSSKQLQSLRDGELVLCAVAINAYALDVVHDQVGHPVGSRPTVEKAYDVGMLEIRKNLTLLSKSLQELGAVQAGTSQLDRHPLSIGVVRAKGEEYAPHAAAADLVDDLIDAEAAPHPLLRGLGRDLRRRPDGARPIMGSQQR